MLSRITCASLNWMCSGPYDSGYVGGFATFVYKNIENIKKGATCPLRIL